MLPNSLMIALILTTAIGCSLIAGTFFAFSTFVMKSLAGRPSEEAIPAMQSINSVILSSLFIPVFLGTAALSLVSIVIALMDGHAPRSYYLIGGGVSYLIGSLLVTIAFNLPRNRTLDRILPGDPNRDRVWADYVAGWTQWNHVRTVASLMATVLFVLAIRQEASP